MAENLIIAGLLTAVLAVFIEFLLPRQTIAFYERVTKRPLARQRGNLNKFPVLPKIPAYIAVAYLSYGAASGSEFMSVLLAAFVCVMGGLSIYFKALRFIFCRTDG